MNLVLITNDNLDLALKTYHKTFSWLPLESDPYTKVVNGEMKETRSRYYLVYDEETLVGLTGFYIVPEDKESAFLGWFGVVPEMRRNHYGSKILKMHEEELRRLGYKYSRLYTETDNNEATRNFYERNGYTAELYNCPEEPEMMANLLCVYSKSLGDWPLPAWNSRNMRIADEAKLMYTEEQLKDPERLISDAMNAKHE